MSLGHARDRSTRAARGELGMVLQPDTLLVSQWRDLHTSSRRTGTQRLCLAVLEDAISVLSKPRVVGTKSTLLPDTLAWFQSNETYWVTSFVTCCDVLGLDPGYLRRLLDQCQWHPRKPCRSRDTRQLGTVAVGRPRVVTGPTRMGVA